MTQRTLAFFSILALALVAGASAHVNARDGSTRARGAASKAGAPVFVITGRGWGHGVGMPQYGAYGFAQHGAGFARILSHYYPGTRLGRAGVAKVKVLLVDGAKRIAVSSAAAFRVEDGDGKIHALPAGTIRLGPALKVKVDPDKPAKALPGPLVFRPGKQPLQLERRYRGRIHVSSAAGKLRAINIVGLEPYLFGVVPSEMPHSWPAEALKAQAVVARSYAMTHRRSGPFDLYSDVRSQVYLGIDHEKPSTNAAVQATAGKVVTYKGKVAETFFYSSSGGRTAAVQDAWPGAKPLPYLVSVRDPYDVLSPYHSWGPLVFSPVRLGRALGAQGALVDVRTRKNPSGRVDSVTAVATGGRISVPGHTVRTELGLRSTFFSVGVLSLVRPSGPPVVFGSSLTLSGLARGIRGAALQHRRAKGAWARVRRVTSRPDGTFAITVKPRISGDYRIAGRAVATAPVSVSVAPLVRLRPPTDATEIRGVVQPLLPGTAVVVERRTGRVWTTVGDATVNPHGDFVARLRVVAGTYRARTAPRDGYGPGKSKPLQVSAP
ncbi:MAG: SpoIID/LytB domain-containing protein [Actinomycetota bacterium]|nr:SpoIID/LytB domain-containing protein [Actinomycetota bacterium]